MHAATALKSIEPDALEEADALRGVCDERQALALDLWLAASQNGVLPLRTALRPERLGDALPVASLVHVDRSGLRPIFRSRIEGRLVVVAFGEPRGRTFRETYAESHLAKVLPIFEQAARGRASLTHIAARTAEGAPFDYTRLLLPWAEPDGKVSRLLSVYSFDVEALAGLSGPLDIGDVVPTSLSGRHAMLRARRRESA